MKAYLLGFSNGITLICYSDSRENAKNKAQVTMGGSLDNCRLAWWAIVALPSSLPSIVGRKMINIIL
jgi:hypothetical protein